MKEKFENYSKALKRLEEALQDKPTAMNMDATIQRFEFTYELAWNTIKAFLFKVGIERLNPRDCIKAAFQQKYLELIGIPRLNQLEPRGVEPLTF